MKFAIVQKNIKKDILILSILFFFSCETGDFSINDSFVYIGSGDGMLYAIDDATGKQKWSIKLNPSYYSTPIVHNNILYTQSNGFYAIDAISGELKWKLDIPLIPDSFPQSSPIINNNICYIGSRIGKFYAIDIINKKVKWEFKTNSGLTMNTPYIKDNTVFFTDFYGTLYAININTGLLEWNIKDLQLNSSPIVYNDLLYIHGQHNIYGIDTKSGLVKWKFDALKSKVIGENLIVENGILYAATSYIAYYENSGFVNRGKSFINIWGINALNGKTIWTTQKENMTGCSAPILLNQSILVTSDSLYSIDALNGHQKWTKYGIHFGYEGVSPTVTENTVYSIVADTLYSFEGTSFKRKWFFHTNNIRSLSPCILTNEGGVYRSLGNIHP